MPRKSTHTSARPNALRSAETRALLAELQRRALGCMIVCVHAQADGDAWHYAVKGSPILLGAMSAALSLQTSRHLAE